MAELISVFNGMADRVTGYQAELREAVERATEEARQKERALILSSRLASMGTLAAGIAHEINNPIGGMLNAVRRLRQTAREGKESEYLDLVLDGLDRVQRTVRTVLDFGPRVVPPLPFSLRDAVGKAAALVQHRLDGEGVRLGIQAGPTLPLVAGNPHEIQQVFLNLFINSLDAIAEREGGPADPGSIQVRLESVRDGGQVFVQASVQDNGSGMDEANLPRVFDPFYTEKRSPNATGLGMAISFAIVKNHGGTMEVFSRKGEGFRTTIRLPAAPSV
jgi:signal transduction histidine kinase